MAKKGYFTSVDPNVDLPILEDEVINYWKINKTFEKSVESRPLNNTWTFLDGPPFVTGMPHYGSLLSSLPKDLFGRFWTMRGYHVRRVWGWDGHGLPIENKVENKLKITRKRDIEEKVGIKRFIQECFKYVNKVSGDWEWYIDHIGRWVDFKNAYKTWDRDYMESVMWVFKQMYEKGYVYKGLRVSLYCPHCVTPISNFEVAMDPDNYKEVTESGTTYKYEVVGEKNTYLLAWSTTPWNKLATPALAVNPKIKYVKVQEGKENYILAKSTLSTTLISKNYKIIDEFSGSKLIGIKFVPHYNFYEIDPGKKSFVVIPGDFVSADEGTGIVTIAAYGEDDLAAMQKENIQVVLHVDEEGFLKKDVPQWGGMYYLNVNKLVNDDLEKRGLIYKDVPHTHTVPTCWRCHTRLFYAPQNAWYVDVQSLKPLMKKTNEVVNWFPKHFKYGRFLKSMQSAPDWCISRSRYWGSPVPVWECECGEKYVPGSIKELEKLSGTKVNDLHKPDIDKVTISCAKCGKTARRVTEVLDSWIEAGSASFAERHFPFEKEVKLEDFFPPDFIAEYTGQIRAWFYVLHVITAALYKSHAFKNVVVTGVILGTDGRKMSKNFGNYPDPKEMLHKYGGDALRLYLMGSPVMHGEDILISEEAYREQKRSILLIIWNVYNFFVGYANIDGWKPSSGSPKPINLLDKWILALLSELNSKVSSSLENFDTVEAIDGLRDFVKNLSNWYIRRSRDRVGPTSDNAKDRNSFYETAYFVLTNFCKIAAPIIPFITESMYQNLTKEESVHLADWPKLPALSPDDKSTIKEMQLARQVVEKAHAQRKDAGIPVRQPLQSIKVSSQESKLSDEFLQIIMDELNIKKVEWAKGDSLKVSLDTKVTPKLKKEGDARDLIRKIQGERKKLGTALDEKVELHLPNWPEEFEGYIKKEALATKIVKGDFKVVRLGK